MSKNHGTFARNVGTRIAALTKVFRGGSGGKHAREANLETFDGPAGFGPPNDRRDYGGSSGGSMKDAGLLKGMKGKRL